MKKLLFLLTAAIGFGTAFDASAQQIKIGTVDMKKIFESYYKTKDAESRINEARNAAKKELDERMEGYQKGVAEVSKLNEFRQTREKQLQDQSARMRQGIVEDINKIVNDKVKAESFDLVFDKSGM